MGWAWGGHGGPATTYNLSVQFRVGSGSDDPGNPGHIGRPFDRSSGSHPQNKLSGCDPDFNRSHVC